MQQRPEVKKMTAQVAISKWPFTSKITLANTKRLLYIYATD